MVGRCSFVLTYWSIGMGRLSMCGDCELDMMTAMKELNL